MASKRSALAAVAAAAALAAAARPWRRSGKPGGRRRCSATIGRRLRRAAGRLDGAVYRLRGGHPVDDVTDETLADRVRSEIGQLTRRLDVPHIHVMVHEGIATLHGDVSTDDDAARLGAAVLDVWGVRGVRSHLHVGLLPSDTRPSAGRDQPSRPSPALQSLVDAASGAGAREAPLLAVRAVLGTFLERLPDGERHHVLDHLPDDVDRVVVLPRRIGDDVPRLRSAEELRDAVLAVDPELDDVVAESVIAATLVRLSELVPEERVDIAAVLPRDLAAYWSRITTPDEALVT